jgi:Hermes transposase DNA-binding domain
MYRYHCYSSTAALRASCLLLVVTNRPVVDIMADTEDSRALQFLLSVHPMAHLVHQALTGQSLSEFKQAIVASFHGRTPQYHIMHYTMTTQPSSLPLWKRFGPVCTVEDNKPVVFVIQRGEDVTTSSKTNIQRKINFVGCHGCLTLYTYNSQTGTSALNSHKCPVPKVSPGGSHSMINYAKANILPNTGQKQLITRSLGEMCAFDIRPFSIVSGKGFRSLLQNVLDIGVASRNPMSIEDLLPDPVTVKRSLKMRCVSTKKVLMSKVQYHFSCGLWAAFTLDIWTDDNHQKSYLSVTIHFIDDSWQLHDRTLQVDAFPNVSHTGAAILTEFNSVVEPYRSFEARGITTKASNKQLIVVTDSASNNHSADGLPSQYEWIPCSDHKIGTVVTSVLAKRTMTIDGKKSAPFYECRDSAPDVFEMITHCKELVAYFKNRA